MLKYIHFDQLDSTNAYLQREQSEHDIRNRVVIAGEQTAGKGMGSNGWESEARQNLTFSLALDMNFLSAERQFLLSKAVPLGIIEVLDTLLPAEKLWIKWPNDIIFEEHKLAGILINSTIRSSMMDVSIIGVGLNVNQMRFNNWPTQPISMRQITGKEYDLKALLKQVVENIINKVELLKTDPIAIEKKYLQRLYRFRTWGNYEVDGKKTRLFLSNIDPFGRLMTQDETGKEYRFDVKEVRFVV